MPKKRKSYEEKFIESLKQDTTGHGYFEGLEVLIEEPFESLAKYFVDKELDKHGNDALKIYEAETADFGIIIKFTYYDKSENKFDYEYLDNSVVLFFPEGITEPPLMQPRTYELIYGTEKAILNLHKKWLKLRKELDRILTNLFQ